MSDAIASSPGQNRETSHQADENIRILRKALWLTCAFFVIELIAGFLSRSLALLSDAGHMLSDILALLISLYASYMSRKAPTAQKSYGYYRTEVLAALFNGLLLFLMIGFIYYEALHRMFQPVTVNGYGVIIVGSAGLAVNLAAAWMLHGHHDLNIHGAYIHVITDALGSLGALSAGILILLTGWYPFDPLLSMFIGAIVLYSCWTLIHDSISILMESVPKHLDPLLIRKELLGCEGVQNIHDLHIWSIGSQSHALSVHVRVPRQSDAFEVRSRIENLLRTKFHLDHTTLQIEIQEGCRETHE
jgi:cobalt-zinc-cadmium efflux system protein